MRVALDVTPLAGSRSGVGWFVAELLPALAAAPGGPALVPYVLSTRAPAGLLLDLEGGPHTPPRRLPIMATAALRLWAHASLPAMDRRLGHPDVVHGTNFVVPPTRRAARVVTVHDTSLLEHPAWCSKRVRSMAAPLRRAVQEGAWVHVPSSFVATRVEDLLDADPERVAVIPHGVPTLDAAADPRAPGARGALPDGPFILAIGTLEPRKNHVRLVEAFGLLSTRLDGVSLVLAGADGTARPAIDAAVAALPGTARDRVWIPGYVGDDARATLLRGAAVLAHPSLDEGFGLPLLEAMRSSTPVVAAAAGALPEVADEAALLVDPRDPVALALALEQVLVHERVAKRLVDAGHVRVAAFSWATTAQRMIELYRAAAAEPRA